MNPFKWKQNTIYTAPTGSGKTYQIVNDVWRELSSLSNTRITIVVNTNSNIDNVLLEFRKQKSKKEKKDLNKITLDDLLKDGIGYVTRENYLDVKYNKKEEESKIDYFVKGINTTKKLKDIKVLITNFTYINYDGITTLTKPVYSEYIALCDRIYIDEAHQYIQSLHKDIQLTGKYFKNKSNSSGEYALNDKIKPDENYIAYKDLIRFDKHESYDVVNYSLPGKINGGVIKDKIDLLNWLNSNSKVIKETNELREKKGLYDNIKFIDIDLQKASEWCKMNEKSKFLPLIQRLMVSSHIMLVTKKATSEYDGSINNIRNLNDTFLRFTSDLLFESLKDKICMYSATFYDNLVPGFKIEKVKTDNVKIKKISLAWSDYTLENLISDNDFSNIRNNNNLLIVENKKDKCHKLNNKLNKEQIHMNMFGDGNFLLIDSNRIVNEFINDSKRFESNQWLGYANHPKMTGANLNFLNSIICNIKIDKPVISRTLFGKTIPNEDERWTTITQIVGRVLRVNESIDDDLNRIIILTNAKQEDGEKLKSILENSFSDIDIILDGIEKPRKERVEKPRKQYQKTKIKITKKDLKLYIAYMKKYDLWKTNSTLKEEHSKIKELYDKRVFKEITILLLKKEYLIKNKMNKIRRK